MPPQMWEPDIHSLNGKGIPVERKNSFSRRVRSSRQRKRRYDGYASRMRSGAVSPTLRVRRSLRARPR
jgi:hypothetical protein